MFLEHDLVSVCCDVNSPAAFSLVLLLIVLKKVSRRCRVVLVVARVGTTGDGLPGRNPLDVAFGLLLQNSTAVHDQIYPKPNSACCLNYDLFFQILPPLSVWDPPNIFQPMFTTVPRFHV